MSTADELFRKALNDVGLAAFGSMTEYREELTATVKAFDEVLALDPGHADAARHRALTLMGLERYEEAVTAYERAIALAPGNDQLRLELAESHHRLGHAEAALSGFDAVLAKAPENLVALGRRAVLLARLGRHLEAIAACDRALSFSARDHRGVPAAEPALHLSVLRANALASLGRPEAKAAYRAILEKEGLVVTKAHGTPWFRDALAVHEPARAALAEHEGAPRTWKLMGTDTFAREDFLIGEFATEAEAKARQRQHDESVASQPADLRDTSWIVPPKK